MSQHLTLRQAARFLAVSQTTLRRMIDRGQLPGELHPGPFGERWMVPREALERLAATRGGDPGMGGPGMGGGVGEDPGVPSEGVGEEGGGPSRGAPGAGEASKSGAGGVAGVPSPGTGGAGGDSESGVPGGGASIPLETLERALELAHRHMDRAQELEADLAIERERACEAQARAFEARERAARAERQAEELRYVLTQHQRALTEAAESLAEERARALAAELTVAQAAHQVSESPEVLDGTQPPESLLRTGRVTQPGWGSRLRRWLGLERTG